MSTTRKKFIDKCLDIVEAKPTYKNGASNTKECDCIGMVKYGLRQNGVTLSTTGTNWTFRNQVTNIRQIKSVNDLKVGDVVFKAKAPGESGYDLPAKYKKGGAGYNGDLNDYCHIGVVKKVNPLQIIHMTSPTAKTDTSIGKWKYAADLLSQYLSEETAASGSTSGGGGSPAAEAPAPAPVPAPAADQTLPIILTGTVCADNGKPVKLRQKASTKCNVYDEIPVGTVVTVTTYKDDWCTVTYRNRKGWFMMTKFLEFG